jgi:beta-N-acetylhexosaminidase
MESNIKLGQRIGIGFSGSKVSEELRRHVREYKTGNIILFRDNMESASQIRTLCRDIQELVQTETGQPALIAVDQEGGHVYRLPAGMVNVPGAMALAASGETGNVALAARITAAELRRVGINLNMAPVLDINCNKDNPVIGSRSFGVRAEDVSKYAIATVKAFIEEGLMCCGKHFPGHGDTSVDSHLDLPSLDRSVRELEERELVPFKAAVEAGIPAIMTSHILFPQIDNLPATMSGKILKGLLREKLGFNGVIISDAMEMNAIKSYYGVPKGCVMALDAGVDIVYICHEPDIDESLAEISAAFKNGRFNSADFDASVERILTCKKRYASFGLDTPEDSEEVVIKRNGQNAALTLSTMSSLEPGKAPPALGSKPFFAGCLPYRPTGASAKPGSALSFSRWFAEKFNGNFAETPVNPNQDEINSIVSAMPDAGSIVMGSYNGHLNRGQIDLALALHKAAIKRGIPFICLALNNPWDLLLLPEGAYGMAVWEYSQKGLEVAAEVLGKGLTPQGVLPRI